MSGHSRLIIECTRSDLDRVFGRSYCRLPNSIGRRDMPRMMPALIGPIVCLGAIVCLSCLTRINKSTHGNQVHDLVIYTPYGPTRHPKSASFYLNGRPIGQDREAFEKIIGRINQLPEGTSIVWGPDYSRCGSCSGSEPQCLPQHLFPDLWKQLEKIVTQRKLKLSSDFPGPWIRPTSRITQKLQASQMSITWRNYRGPDTPHHEVIYLLDETYVGRGDQGFDQVLKRLDQLPEGTKVQWTQYKWTGRVAFDRFDDDELRQRNNALKGLVPFQDRRHEFEQRLHDRKLSFDKDDADTDAPGEVATVLDWGAGDNSAATIASVGRIIHYGEQPRSAAVRFGWSNYGTNDREGREPESTAVITVNGRHVGKGIYGFGEGIKEIETLPPGSVVQVKVCLRTKGPFTCPLIYEGQRHFERSGYEPYFGMYDWLIAVVSTKQLEIEWLPDEARSCYACELNR